MIGDHTRDRPPPDLIADLMHGAAGRAHPHSSIALRPALLGTQAAVRSPNPASAPLRCPVIWTPQPSLTPQFASASRTASRTRS